MIDAPATAMDIVGFSLCMPVALLINFALFQYLLTMYYKRRKEPLGTLLLGCALLGFVALVPFSFPDDSVVCHLNDISETCSVLTFLIQITIIGRDITKRVRIRALQAMTIIAELLIALGLFVVAQNVFAICFPRVDVSVLHSLDNIMEDVGLWFIFVFRFLILGMSRGWRHIATHKKLEVGMYLLFITHEYPFVALQKHSIGGANVSWERVQALWNRSTLAMCIALTIRDKYRKTSSTSGGGGNTSKINNATTTTASQGPDVMRLSSVTPISRIAPVQQSRRSSLRSGSAIAPSVRTTSSHFVVRQVSVSGSVLGPKQ